MFRSKIFTSLCKMSRSLKRVKIGEFPPVFLVFLCPKAEKKQEEKREKKQEEKAGKTPHS